MGPGIPYKMYVCTCFRFKSCDFRTGLLKYVPAYCNLFSFKLAIQVLSHFLFRIHRMSPFPILGLLGGFIFILIQI